MPGYIKLMFEATDIDKIRKFNFQGICDCGSEKQAEQKSETDKPEKNGRKKYPIMFFSEQYEKSGRYKVRDYEAYRQKILVVCCEKQLDEWMKFLDNFEQKFHTGVVLNLSLAFCVGCCTHDDDRECDRECDRDRECERISIINQIKNSHVNLDKFFQRKWEDVEDPKNSLKTIMKNM